MTPDEARKLLGGYATDSLTEAERTALFQAALEDQDLFDELAGEQALKEVLEEPGARQRLLTALEPPRRHRAWLWATAAATLATAVVIGIVVSQRATAPPQQIAQVFKSPEPVAAPVAPPSAAPVPAPAPAPAIVRRNGPPAPPPVSAPEPPPELKKEKTNAAAAEQVDQLQQAKPQAATGALRQFATAAPKAGVARAQNDTVTVTVGPVVFSYAIGADGFLQITTVEAGFVSVAAEFTDKDVVVFPASEVAPKMSVRIQVPANATGLIIGFSRTPGLNDSRIGRPLVPGLGFDPDPPNRRFRIEVPATVITPPSLTPATR